MVFGPKNEWSLNFSLQNEQTKSWTSISNSESGETLILTKNTKWNSLKHHFFKLFRELRTLKNNNNLHELTCRNNFFLGEKRIQAAFIPSRVGEEDFSSDRDLQHQTT